eukprot:15459538-Alexandrium_andersonii.AAC.1
MDKRLPRGWSLPSGPESQHHDLDRGHEVASWCVQSSWSSVLWREFTCWRHMQQCLQVASTTLSC